MSGVRDAIGANIAGGQWRQDPLMGRWVFLPFNKRFLPQDYATLRGVFPLYRDDGEDGADVVYYDRRHVWTTVVRQHGQGQKFVPECDRFYRSFSSGGVYDEIITRSFVGRTAMDPVAWVEHLDAIRERMVSFTVDTTVRYIFLTTREESNTYDEKILRTTMAPLPFVPEDVVASITRARAAYNPPQYIPLLLQYAQSQRGEGMLLIDTETVTSFISSVPVFSLCDVLITVKIAIPFFRLSSQHLLSFCEACADTSRRLLAVFPKECFTYRWYLAPVDGGDYPYYPFFIVVSLTTNSYNFTDPSSLCIFPEEIGSFLQKR